MHEDLRDGDAQTEDAEQTEQAEVEALQTPAIVEEAPTEAPKSPLRAWAERLESRLVAVERAAHSGHHLDEAAIEQIVSRVLERLHADFL